MSRTDSGAPGRVAVVLAGGKGTRLAPYTVVLPKPLMPLGDMPILELVLRQLRRYGFSRVVLAVGHLGQLIEAYFGDGSLLEMDLLYAREREPLGTAGPLALIPGLDRDFLVMNGDVLTSLDLAAFLDSHSRSGAPASIATHVRTNQVDFGVVEANQEGDVVGYIEKPEHRYLVSMGVYAFSPAAVGHITPGERLDFPDLVLRLLAAGERVRSVPFEGYWLDIGRHDDLARAQEELEAHRTDFLGEEA